MNYLQSFFNRNSVAFDSPDEAAAVCRRANAIANGRANKLNPHRPTRREFFEVEHYTRGGESEHRVTPTCILMSARAVIDEAAADCGASGHELRL